MFKQIAIAAALVIASSSAMAQQATKFYAGAEVSTTKLEDAGSESGVGGFVGYKFNQNLAIEAGYNRLASGNIDFEGDKVDIDFNQTNLSVIGTLPLSNGFSVFGRLGYNDIRVKARFEGDSESAKLDDGVVYGLGLGYAFSPAISARVELSVPVSEMTKVAAGVVFHF